MRYPISLIAAALAAAVALSIAVATASANYLALSSRTIYIRLHPLTWTAEGETVECDVTLLGSFHEAVVGKVEGALIGSVTHAEIENPCTGGTATILEESLPWHITYANYTAPGGLPNIERVRILLIGLAINIFYGSFGVACLGQSEEAEPVGGWLELEGGGSGSVANFRVDERLKMALSGAFFCALAGSTTFSGTGTVEDGESASLVVSLEEEPPPPPARHTLTFSPAGEMSLDSLGAIRLEGESVSMSCDWTLRGALSRAAVDITEVSEAAIGSISSHRADHCSGGSIETVLGTPWTLEYTGVTGSWPEEATAIGVRIDGFAVKLATFGRHVECLYRGNLTGTLELSGVNPYPTGLVTLAEARLSLVSGEGCPRSIAASGTFWLDPEQRLTFRRT
jgi:hypothetical protein